MDNSYNYDNQLVHIQEELLNLKTEISILKKKPSFIMSAMKNLLVVSLGGVLGFGLSVTMLPDKDDGVKATLEAFMAESRANQQEFQTYMIETEAQTASDIEIATGYFEHIEEELELAAYLIIQLYSHIEALS